MIESLWSKISEIILASILIIIVSEIYFLDIDTDNKKDNNYYL